MSGGICISTATTTALCVLLLVLVSAVNSSQRDDNSAPSPRIFHGHLARRENSTHMVSVHFIKRDWYRFGWGHRCGGSLIAAAVVLTAAHCLVSVHHFIPAREFRVVMGNLNRFARDNNTLVYDVERIVYGPNRFNSATYENDVALLFLNDSVPLGHPTVRPIDINRRPLAAGTVCQTAGWGLTETGELPSELRAVEVALLSDAACRRETDLGLAIQPNMLCAGYLQGGRDACDGDSGGPLVCAGVLAGITSWGFHCGEPRRPGVYTDVQFYAPWIDANVLMQNALGEGEATPAAA